MGYVKIPEPPKPKPEKHKCYLPGDSVSNAIWQCDGCGIRYIYRPSTFWGLMGLFLFILWPVGFLYGWYSWLMNGWVALGIFQFFRGTAYLAFTAVSAFIIYAIVASSLGLK